MLGIGLSTVTLSRGRYHVPRIRSMRGSFLSSNRAVKPLPISEARRKRFHSIAVVPETTMELQPSADLRLPCSPFVAAAMAPKAVPSAATTLRPLLWCPSTSKAQLLLAWTAQARRLLVADNRHRQRLTADERPLADILLSNAMPSVVISPRGVF